MEFFDPTSFTGAKAWEALDIAEIEGATVRLHWTDQPYVWHENDGVEVFVVLEGSVTMHYRVDGLEHEEVLEKGDFCRADTGDEHVAHPNGAARILVVEKKGSI